MAAVLFVDDEPDLLELARCFLEVPGRFSIDTKTSAQDALESLSHQQYDAIVCDYEMPGVNGIELLKSVRQAFGDIPFIIFTGHGREQVVIDALNNGADFYIQKGGDPDALFVELKHIIEQAIALKQTRKTLYEREQRYHDLQNANDLIQSVSPEGRFIYVNRKWLETLGYSEKDVQDLSIFDIIHEESLQHCMETFGRVIAGENVGIIDAVFKTRNGERVFVEGMANCRMIEGKPQYTRGIFKDVTGRKKTEKALLESEVRLRESESRYRALVEATSDMVWEVDKNGRYTYVSPKIRDMLGYSAEEVIGKTPFDLMSPDEAEKIFAVFQEVSSARRPIKDLENVNLHKNGHLVILETSGEPVYAADGTFSGYRGIDRDITDRKHAVAEIHENAQYLKTLLASIPAGVMVVDAETHRIIEVNPAALDLFGSTRDRVLGRICHRFICPAAEGSCPITDLGRTIDKSERVLINSRGETVPILKSVSRVDMRGQPVLIETFTDISDRIKAEEALSQVNRQLNLMNKITRHDILNNVTIILGYLSLMRKNPDGNLIDKFFDKIEHATKTIQSQIQFTRVYQDLGTHKPQWWDIHEILPFLSVPPEIAFVADLNRFEIYADPLVEKVFFNLLDNSIRHGQTVTSIRVFDTMDSEKLVLVWEDNGVGVAANEKKRIFDRGYGKNTGLGLYLVREILTITGITIHETGEPGKGARFEITVPEGKYRHAGTEAATIGCGRDSPEVTGFRR